MPRPTNQLFCEIIEAAKEYIVTLETKKVMTEGEDLPTQAECAAIERVQMVLRAAVMTIKAELSTLERYVDSDF